MASGKKSKKEKVRNKVAKLRKNRAKKTRAKLKKLKAQGSIVA